MIKIIWTKAGPAGLEIVLQIRPQRRGGNSGAGRGNRNIGGRASRRNHGQAQQIKNDAFHPVIREEIAIGAADCHAATADLDCFSLLTHPNDKD
jgi:hypothetical protein